MVFVLTIFVSIICFSLIKNNFIKASFSVLPLLLALFVASSRTFWAEIEFYVLVGFLCRELFSYQDLIWRTGLTQLGLRADYISRQSILKANQSFVQLDFRRVPFLVINFDLVLLYTYFLAVFLTNTGFFFGIFSLLVIVVISGLQPTFLPCVLIGLTLATIGYLIEIIIFKSGRLLLLCQELSENKEVQP